MSVDSSSDIPSLPELRVHMGSCEVTSPLTAAEMMERRNAKIREIKGALKAAGVVSLDKQAQILGLSRSTAWHLHNGKHKGSGLSPTVINQMFAAPRLPPAVGEKLLEYIGEKVSGQYGDNKLRLNRFMARLSRGALNRASGVGRLASKSNVAKFR
jgi:hypothetical protein